MAMLHFHPKTENFFRQGSNPEFQTFRTRPNLHLSPFFSTSIIIIIVTIHHRHLFFKMVDSSSDPFDFDIDSANNVEETAYQDGYQQGFDHGALHGTFEGRELGREKGFELWEEVGFYKGMAEVWRLALEQADAAGHNSRKQSKQIQHLAGLERLISFFPITNTSSDPSTDLNQTATSAGDSDAQEDVEMEEDVNNNDGDDELAKLDMLTLLEKIRAKYRLTCSVLGVAPQRTALTQIGSASSGGETQGDPMTETKSVLVAGKLVDPTQLHY